MSLDGMRERGPAGLVGALGRVGRRGLVAGGAYLLTSLVIVVVIYALGRLGEPRLLREVLAIQFIASLAGGLDPATAKSVVLREVDGDTRAVSVTAMLVAGAIKGCLVAPVLAGVWSIADPMVDRWLFAWLPLVCTAGFLVTDLRVTFDLAGRYATAIFLKQGSLGLGLIVLAALAAAGLPLMVATGAATLSRLAVAGIGARKARGTNDTPFAWSQVRSVMSDRRWLELAAASAVAAIGGSADRVFGLRFLSPPLWTAYYLIYEVLGKFWFIPYVLSPILFARTASGVDSARTIRAAWWFTVLSGALFVAAIALLLRVVPDAPTRLLGARGAASIDSFAIIAFAGGVAINSLAQLRIAELQGRGAARRTLVLMAVSAVITTVVFYVAAMRFGVSGLLSAWLIKSALELAATYVPPSPPARLRTQRIAPVE